MNLIEALKNFYDGKRIGRKEWYLRKWYQLKEDGSISCGGRYTPNMMLNLEDIQSDDWEVFENGVLNKKDKEYIENLIRPYLDNYEFTFKKVLENEHYFLEITFVSSDEADEIEYIQLPLYRINEPMFEEIETNCLYTSNDLELFR